MPAPVVLAGAANKPVRLRVTATGPGLPSVAVSAAVIAAPAAALTDPLPGGLVTDPLFSNEYVLEAA